MKKMTVFTILGIAVLGLTAAAAADTAATVRANVPFAFYAGKELMPAGDYIFQVGHIGPSASASTVVVRNESGTVASILMTRPGDSLLGDDAHLHFNHYGKVYFLSRIEGGGYQADLTPSPAEREMRAQGASAGSNIVVASR